MRSRAPEIVGPLALVILAALVLHASALARPFFADDYLFLDLVARQPGLSAFAAPDAIGNYFRPLARAGWFALLSPLTGQNSAAFHAANLALFAGALVLFAFVAWRMLGGRATGRAAATGAIVAAAYLAVHEAFDVPVGWVSGSQDLLALVCGLAAVLLALTGRAWWGALALLAGLLCKESIAPLPLIVCALAWARGSSWKAALRTTAPSALATALWGAAWWTVRARGVAAHAPVHAGPADALAALWHGAQTALGLELATNRGPQVSGASAAAVALAVLAALVAAWPRAASTAGAGAPGPAARKAAKARAKEAERVVATREAAHPAAAHGAARPRAGAVALAGLAWFALAALATAPVATIWSAYYHTFALCGAALALGALVAMRGRWVAAGAVAVLGLVSAQTRAIDQFAARENRWIAVSHVNRVYLDRGMKLLGTLASELKAAQPSVPPRTTFFFSGVPAFTGFQVGDGPFVRYAYHDTTLRSRFLSSFSHGDVERGPVLFLSEVDGKLEDRSNGFMFALLGTVLIVGDHVPQAKDAFRASVEHEPQAAKLGQLWLDWLNAPGPHVPTTDPVATQGLAAARGLLARGDSTQAFNQLVALAAAHPDDARVHALAADLVATVQPNGSFTLFQAYATRTLTPDDPAAWRRWALLVVGLRDDIAGLRAIEEWKRRAGPAATQDPTMVALERALRAHQSTARLVAAALGPR